MVEELRQHEKLVCWILEKTYNIKPIVIKPGIGKTPDIDLGKLGIWEIKSPKGNSKNTIENNFRQARRQSENIIIDLSRCKMRSDVAIRKIKKYCLEGHKALKHVKIVTKDKKIIDVL